MPTILITGANRGIGFELARHYAAEGWKVFAARRSADDAVPEGTEAVLLDVADPAAIRALAERMNGEPIDILWNNAGIYLDKGQTLQDLSNADWLRSFEVNCIAPIRLAQALMPNVAGSAQKAMVFTSSRMASIAGYGTGSYAYRSSKAALNMAVRRLALEYGDQGISCVMLHPGWVRTDMGGGNADIDTKTSVAGMTALVSRVSPTSQAEFNGCFFDFDGSPIDW